MIIWGSDLSVLAWDSSFGVIVPGQEVGRQGGSQRRGGGTWGCPELPANGGPDAEQFKGQSPSPCPLAAAARPSGGRQWPGKPRPWGGREAEAAGAE